MAHLTQNLLEALCKEFPFLRLCPFIVVGAGSALLFAALHFFGRATVN